MMIEILQRDPIFYLRIIVIVIFSITLHELAHGVIAISQGDDTPVKTGHITPNPIVHMGLYSIAMLFFIGISWGVMPVNPLKFRHPRWSDFWVSFAGPLLNLLLTIISVTLIKMTLNYNLVLSTQFLFLTASINLQLFLLNLFPIPPLDGFHMFCAFFPKFKSLEGSSYGFAAQALLFLLIWAGGLSSFAQSLVWANLPQSIICLSASNYQICR